MSASDGCCLGASAQVDRLETQAMLGSLVESAGCALLTARGVLAVRGYSSIDDAVVKVFLEYNIRREPLIILLVAGTGADDNRAIEL